MYNVLPRVRYKEVQTATDHWVFSKLFVISEDLRNRELGMERAEKEINNLRRII